MIKRWLDLWGGVVCVNKEMGIDMIKLLVKRFVLVDLKFIFIFFKNFYIYKKFISVVCMKIR